MTQLPAEPKAIQEGDAWGHVQMIHTKHAGKTLKASGPSVSKLLLCQDSD